MFCCEDEEGKKRNIRVVSLFVCWLLGGSKRGRGVYGLTGHALAPAESKEDSRSFLVFLTALHVAL